MKTKIHTPAERINFLRKIMKSGGISAYIIPSSDPHLSEYIADHWKIREWISGFTGSAGTIVITTKQAGLWTDSRYFLQAESELQGSGISLFKEGEKDVPDFVNWIIDNLNKGESVGIDGELFPTFIVEKLHSQFTAAGIELKRDISLINDNRIDLPPIPKNKAYIYDSEFAGISVSEKLKSIGKKLADSDADIFLLTALDEIAWTFNIRGNDVDYNPVCISYGLAAPDSGYIFIDEEKMTPELFSYFEKNNIKVLPYDSIFTFLSQLTSGCKIAVDKQKTNYALYRSISSEATIIEATSPIELLKAVKNETEIEGTKNAMIKDGVALVNAFSWLDEQLTMRKSVSELSFIEKLRKCRKEQAFFICESFATIAGFGEHGAIVHYRATEDSNKKIENDNLFLIDSGGNYLDGTTDITRTIVIGEPSEKQKTDYTTVLKGHIALASCKFPENTHGSQIDILARQFLWNNMENYGHGTGHGIGHFLNVHEGPQNIRPKDNGVSLLPGMILSNEPGIYQTNEYGIRIENIVLIKEAGKSSFGIFLELETLTLFPFETNLIKNEMLTSDEKNWINNYHKQVFCKLSPFLNDKEKEWLENKTKPIVASI
jgi:Xaa-Pro aminopeptidase